MQVFISWSGIQSKAIAELLNDWIPCVIQAVKPWISTTEIDKGSVWFSEITNQLKETSVGIVCVTRENRDRPWLLFEAGALLKRVSKNRVCTFLVDLKYTDVKDPLAQFNHTVYDKADVYKLLKTINDSMESGNLEEPRLRKIFETNWPEFATRFDEILKSNAALQTQPDKPKRDPDDMMAEILDNTRQLNKRVGVLESNLRFDEFNKTLNAPSAIDWLRFLKADNWSGNYFDKASNDARFAEVAKLFGQDASTENRIRKPEHKTDDKQNSDKKKK